MKPLKVCGLYKMSPKSAKLTFDRPVSEDELNDILIAIKTLVRRAQEEHQREKQIEQESKRTGDAPGSRDQAAG
jgi:hypothetical protein